MRRKPVWKELEECAGGKRERYVQRSWSIKESDLFKEEKRGQDTGGGGGVWYAAMHLWRGIWISV